MTRDHFPPRHDYRRGELSEPEADWQDDDTLSAARGMFNGMLMVIAFWGAVALVWWVW